MGHRAQACNGFADLARLIYQRSGSRRTNVIFPIVANVSTAPAEVSSGPLKLMPFLANSAGGIDPGKLVLALTFASIAVLFIQFVIAKLVWRASTRQILKVGAISLVGLLCAATPFTLFLLPVALIGSHFWVAYRG